VRIVQVPGRQRGVKIEGRRKDLTRIREPETVVWLDVSTSQLGSLSGLEAMISLERLSLERLSAPDLSPLLGAPSLRLVSLDLRGDTDFSVVSELRGVTDLYLTAYTPAGAESLTQVAYSRLANLRILVLEVETDQPVGLETGWIPSHPALRELELRGVVPASGRVDDLARATQLTYLSFTPARGSDLAQLRAALPRAEIQEEGLRPPAWEIIDLAGEAKWGFALRVDLVALWDAETNYGGEHELRQELEAVSPELAARLHYDTESDSVVVLAQARDDLTDVLEIVQRRLPPE
jgi:hypothetical protein